MRYIANVSFGKDSLCMLHRLIDTNQPLDEVMFYDTGAEFEAVYKERDRTLPLLEREGIEYVELHPEEDFWFKMFAHPTRSRKTGEIYRYGYGWCGGACRWGTRDKITALEKEATKDSIVYVGIAADETERLMKEVRPNKRFPLVDMGITESECLEYCYAHGHEWDEHGVRLYDVLDRVSCWCCRNKNMKELRAIHDNLPETWQRLLGLEEKLGQMKGKPLSEIGEGK